MVPEMGSQPSTIAITLNGEPRSIPSGQTLLDLLRSLDLDPERVAVELDRQIAKRPVWSERVLDEGARIEIVQFVGGG